MRLLLKATEAQVFQVLQKFKELQVEELKELRHQEASTLSSAVFLPSSSPSSPSSMPSAASPASASTMSCSSSSAPAASKVDSTCSASAKPEPKPESKPESKPKALSDIRPIDLEECVGGGQGLLTTVSILEPVMRIERTGKKQNEGESGPKPAYRIILNFKMQLSINNSQGRHNRIFDSVDVRYLYRRGERHDLLPKGDAVLTDITLTHEDDKEREVEAGVSATVAGGPTPAFTVHASHARKVTYERKLRSWRKSLAYETYPPPRTGTGGGLTTLLGVGSSEAAAPVSYFRVSSDHAGRCGCRRIKPWRCRHRHSHHHEYDRSAHWSGQTEAQLHLWSPEIYHTIDYPLTIAREVDAEEIDAILNQGPSCGLSELRRYLHFDFDVEVRLREIGWGFWRLFKSSSKPAEIRAKNDWGKPLPPDKSKFCVSCCIDRIHWPRFETRDLQVEAEKQCAKYGYVKRLQVEQGYKAKIVADSTSRTATFGLN
ncbi:hypothetical protein B0T14DRAFT_602581 [Immersiella caudata]|uniref:Uncharacterized protein n=1 Tax=Immersiella caudata TaxID=314043 RepID=A0AA39WYV5_9PEZI|nr:hypothetical protein B0T14DRAFT_602581 [Immersiella caudata]